MATAPQDACTLDITSARCANRVRLQHQYKLFFIIADLHTLTTKPEPQYIKEIPTFIRDIVLDYLAVGIDPNVSTVFVQSAIPETYQLNLLFEMLVTVPRLERMPTLKDLARDAHIDSMPFGLLGYPVLQAVDILLPRAQAVPVGRDNQSHVELAREMARALQQPLRRSLPRTRTHHR